MKTTLIIPALNDADAIGSLLRRVPREVVDEVIVVDNGSTDATGSIAARAAIRLRPPPPRELGTRLVGAFVVWRYRVTLSDIGPYRAIRVPLLTRLGMRDRAFGWPVEMVVKAAAAGARIAEVPVSHAPRQGGRSKVSGTLSGSVRAGYAFVTTALRAARGAS